MKHTPGPWSITGEVLGLAIVTQDTFIAALGPHNEVANSRLIAAAPEMVKLLSRATQAPANWEQWMQDARALLARIEGA